MGKWSTSIIKEKQTKTRGHHFRQSNRPMFVLNDTYPLILGRVEWEGDSLTVLVEAIGTAPVEVHTSLIPAMGTRHRMLLLGEWAFETGRPNFAFGESHKSWSLSFLVCKMGIIHSFRIVMRLHKLKYDQSEAPTAVCWIRSCWCKEAETAKNPI